MAVDNLTWTILATGEPIYSPLLLTTSSSLEIQLSNLGDTDITDLGLYITPSTNLGSVDYPPDFGPDTDYQDVLTWGSATEAAITLSGGLILSLPQEDTSIVDSYVTRDQGCTAALKLPMANILAGESAIITLTIESPGVGARRLFISLVADDN